MTIHIGANPGDIAETVLLPGDPERRARAVRRRDGIEVEDPTVAELMAVAEEFGVDDTQLRELE